MPSNTFGHLALHYRDIDDAALATTLLRELGFKECYSIPSTQVGPYSGAFYHFVIDPSADRGTDRILYLLQMPPPLRAVYDEIHARLRVGASDQSPTVTAMRQALARDPEYGFHAAILMHSLEDLEAMVERLTVLSNDPAFCGRVRVTLNRARLGVPAVDQRMDASRVFSGVTRYTYGPNGVQVFVETDLLVGGPLGDNFAFEFDYVFPGYKDNILNAPSLDVEQLNRP
jgi:hypothetical protein